MKVSLKMMRWALHTSNLAGQAYTVIADDNNGLYGDKYCWYRYYV